MAKGRAVAIVLEAAEKSELTALTRKHGAPQALAERSRIVLAAAGGLNNKGIAAVVGRLILLICGHRKFPSWRPCPACRSAKASIP